MAIVTKDMGAERAEETNKERARSASPDEKKFTAGPWRHDTLLVKDAHGEVIAHCTRWERGTPKPEIADANASLIAAAPDLLEACKAVLRCKPGHDERGHAYLIVPARSLNDLAAQIAFLIEKAEGR